MNKKLALLLYLVLPFFGGNARSQTKSLNLDALRARLSLYSRTNSSEILFVHTDKTLYTNNEAIWFSAYLINNGPVTTRQHSILSLSLMREDDRKIFFEQQHVIKDNFSNGSLVIPNNIPPGNYLLNACTNLLDQHGKPVLAFSQPITIKSIMQSRFNATLTLLDTTITNGVIKANVSLIIKDYERKGKPVISYSIGNGKQQKISLADDDSNVNISIPAAQLIGSAPVLLTAVSYNYDTLYLSVKLPRRQSKALNVRFFPEGGNLTNGLESLVGLETNTADGLPLSLSGTLYADDKLVGTVNTNSYGIGRFRLKPDAGSRYTLKVKANNYIDRDSIYHLPDMLENGVNLHLSNAVVNDTLVITVYSKAARKLNVLVHNYREHFNYFDIQATGNGKKVSLPLAMLPKGIATVTLLDEEGRPLAERLFFAHYDQKISAFIKTDKEIYNKRDSVQAGVLLKDHMGNPIQGVLSIAALQESRVEGDKELDIESYVYLNHDLGPLPRDPQGRGFNNKSFLEDMFLTKGWRRYSWQALMQNKATDTLKLGEQPEFRGNVLHRGKPIKDSLQLLVLRNKKFDKLITAADGSFTLNPKLLEIAEGNKVNLWSDMLEQKGYTIQLINPFKAINRQVADAAILKNWGIAQTIQSSTDQQLKGTEKSIVLNEVNIKGAKNNGPMYGQRNECGDYVCQSGYLNCIYHNPSNSKVYAPVKGQPIFGGVYQGCTSTGKEVFAIYTAREFYGLNRNPDGQLEPQYLSTLFWKPGVRTNEKGETSFSFFTGDITGKFRIVVQGTSGKDVVYGDGEITVR